MRLKCLVTTGGCKRTIRFDPARLGYYFPYARKHEHSLITQPIRTMPMPTASRLRSLCLTISFFAAVCAARPHPLDTLFLASEDIPLDMRIEGLGGAGVGIIENVSSVILNPALIHAFVQDRNTHLSTIVNYGRDDLLFTDHQFTVGAASKVSEMGTTGLLYHYSQASRDRFLHEAVLTWAGPLFQGDTAAGYVDIGINLRYQGMQWRTEGFDSLWTIHHPLASDTPISRTSASLAAAGRFESHRLLLDIGLFQKKVSDAIDFGLTFTNVLGYAWKKIKPAVKMATDTTDSEVVDSLYYSDEISKSNGWLNRYYKGITCGILYHAALMENKLLLQLPADVNVIGLFDRSPHFTFRTGLEACIMSAYSLRIGYSRAPQDVIHGTNLFRNENIISGGAGFHTDHFSFDLAIRKSRWAGQLGINF
jgi:hypothetical protein